MIGWWPGDGNANDIVGGNHGILEGGATFGTGMVGQAFQLDGINDFVRVPYNPSLDFGESPFTVALWIKINAFHYWEQAFIEKWVQAHPGDNSKGWSYTYRNDGLILSYGNGGTLPASCCSTCLIGHPDVQQNTWHHIAATRSEEVFKIYWDGSLLESITEGGTYDLDTPNSTSLKFGARGNGEQADTLFLNGMIDEVQIFNRALSDSEILAIYSAGSAGICKAPALTCEGFEPPMDNGPVTVKKNRVLPFKSTLLNGSVPVTNLDIVAPPVIQVLYNSGIGDVIDVTEYSLPAGQGTEGNQFEFDGTWWHFNLATKKYIAAGTYTVSMVSGDATEYIIDPTCTAQFVIEKCLCSLSNKTNKD